MSIKLKMLLTSAFLAVLLGSTLALTYYSFWKLNNGFQQVLVKAEAGVENSKAAETTFSRADSGMVVVSKNMTEIADAMAKTNMRIRIIERKMKGISGTMTDLAESVEEIYDQLPEGDANDIVGTIATAVEEQSASTREIANNIAHVSSGIGEVNHNVASSSAAASSVTDEIDQVHQAVNNISMGSNRVKQYADELKQLATGQNDMVCQFKVC